jgi:hypothetical protein
VARERRERQLRAAQADTKLVQVQMVEMRKQYTQERRDWQAHEQQLNPHPYSNPNPNPNSNGRHTGSS